MKKVEKTEKFIYCWQCGKKNPKKKWFCQDPNCHARLKQHDHPIIYWLFGEILDNTEDGIIKYITDLIINFLHLHLYGVTMGVALTFTLVATFSNYDQAKDIEITQNKYFLAPTEENEDVPTMQETTVTETPKEDISENKETSTKPKEDTKKETPQTENKKENTKNESVTESKKEDTKVESTKTCPSGYQMRSDGKCESITYKDALGFVECENGYDKVNSKGVQSSANTDVFCMSRSPYAAGTKYCPSTRDDFIAKYGSDSCINASSSFTGSLSGSNCNYTFYGADGTQTACSNTYTYQYKCPEGDYFQVDQWCYDKKPTITNYYCFDKATKKYVLTTDRKCRTVIEATAN